MRKALLTVAATVLIAPASALAGSVFLVEGGGWGHGVGMSQWGAEGAALHGWGYQRILAHYYPGTQLAVERGRDGRVLSCEQQTQLAIGSAAPFLVVDARGRKVHVKPRVLRFATKLRLGGRPL